MAYIGQKPHNKVVTASEITDGIITADKLASNAVTTAKINADAVTDAKIADDVVGTEHLTAGEVDTTALGADAVTAAKIADNAISEEHLDATIITGLTALTSAPADTDELLISDAGTLKRIDVSLVGQTNKPAFHATNSATQDLNSGSYHKVEFNTETFDENGVYDHSSNYRFTPGETGKFFIYYRLGLITPSTATNKYPYLVYGRLYQDGSQSDALGELFIKRDADHNFQEVYLHAGGVVNVTSTSTYFELYALATNAAGAADTNVNTGSYFGAFKLAGV
jgi:hypothetical protein